MLPINCIRIIAATLPASHVQTVLSVRRYKYYVKNNNGITKNLTRNFTRIVGTKYLLPNGAPHNDNGPAEIDIDGTQRWYSFGRLHRDERDGPAVIWPHNCYAWYSFGCLHRTAKNAQGYTLPALIMFTSKSWYSFGRLHRQEYRKNQLLPAVINNGKKQWWINGMKRRTVLASGSGFAA